MSIQAEADRRRAAAAELALRASKLPEVLAEVGAYDRPDVWRGGRADRFRADLDDQRRILEHASSALADTAARLARRAEALEALAAAVG